MDSQSDKLESKKILVHLEDENRHLLASIGHLENKIKERELMIQELLAERELVLVRDYPEYKRATKIQSPELEIPDKAEPEYDSEFTKIAGCLIDNILKTTEEVSNLIKL